MAYLGDTLYAVVDSGSSTRIGLYTLDIATGTLTRVGNSTEFGLEESGPLSLANANGTLYMFGHEGKLYTLSTVTGAATEVAAVTGSANASFGLLGMTYLDGVMYASDGNSLHILKSNDWRNNQSRTVDKFGCKIRLAEG